MKVIWNGNKNIELWDGRLCSPGDEIEVTKEQADELLAKDDKGMALRPGWKAAKASKRSE
ncbi:MAG: hypothetical protein R3344_07115 [Acidobacteriota bacterium]|nr:hypothetical protein [Acidobacteriota bacterium]